MKESTTQGERADGPRKELASLLRSARLDHGLSGQELADALGWSQSKVSKIENGRTRPTTDDVRAWLDACRAPEDVVRQSAELAEAALVESRHWRVVHARGLRSGQDGVRALERRAEIVRSFQPSLVPGLLQTAEYARQVLSAVDLSGQRDVPEAVAARMRRQETLYDPGRRFEFTLTEAALRWYPHDVGLLVAQVDRLLSVATLTNVALRVLPLSSPFGHLQSNGFLLFEIPGEPTVIVETFTRELAITDPEEVGQYRDIHAALTEHALDEAASRDYLRDFSASL
ncbi:MULTISPECIES: helix-turn-helix domain-containing protein [unclassified Nocardiopsis]|uniref:helix-turn-helix domain-containing protein n=1 Tax=Nocardiopsis TaxID=2013 RepID=UPI00387B4A01